MFVDRIGRVRRASHWGLLAVATLLILSAGRASADCGSDYLFIDQPPDVQGTTFIGTYLGRDPVSEPPTDSFRVDRVYAGDLGGTVTYDVQACHPFRHLSPGVRYLFSTSDIAQPTARDTVVYRLSRGSRVTLVGIDGPAKYYIPIWHLDRLADVLALVVPDLPPTDAGPVIDPGATARSDAEVLAIVAAGIGAAGAFVALTRLRGRTARPR